MRQANFSVLGSVARALPRLHFETADVQPKVPDSVRLTGSKRTDSVGRADTA